MSNTGDVPTPIEPEVAPAPPEPDKASKATRRMERALASLQKERDDLAAQLTKVAEDTKRASMTELERYKADAEARAREVEAARAEAAVAKAERERERLVSRLVAKHKMADPEYGDLVLKGYDPKTHEDFDAFVDEIKVQPRYRVLFGSERIVDESGEDIVPNSRSVSTKTKKQAAEVDLEEFAASMFPNDKARQKSYIETVRKLSVGGK